LLIYFTLEINKKVFEFPKKNHLTKITSHFHRVHLYKYINNINCVA